ncbi:MAG: hypothetical protein PVJ55_02035 [Anaerolineae bacterium]|jgi:hypothetical protein
MVAAQLGLGLGVAGPSPFTALSEARDAAGVAERLPQTQFAILTWSHVGLDRPNRSLSVLRPLLHYLGTGPGSGAPSYLIEYSEHQ